MTGSRIAVLVAIVSVSGITASPCRAQYFGVSSQGGYQNDAQNTNYPGSGGRLDSNEYRSDRQSQSFSEQQMETQPARQSSTMQDLEQELNSIDTSSAWSRTPVVSPAVVSPGMNSNPNGSTTPYIQYGPASAPLGGLLPRVNRWDVLRVFLQGGSLFDHGGAGMSAPGPGAGAAQATSTAYSNYQQAENMATRARNAADRARYGSDKGSKQNAASEAYYDANDAEGAADRAYSASASGDSQARGYANLAREAANRAREDANRARYNADTSS